MSDRFTYIGSSDLFLIEDERIWLQRRFQTRFEDGKYGVPAGHLDGNETAKEGCVREIKEEIGITLLPNDLNLVHVMHRKAQNEERIDFLMTAAAYNGEITNCEPEKCDDLQWFSLDSLPENMVDYVKVALEQSKSSVFYSEYG